MENINGKKNENLLFKSDLIRIGDLQFYEGSLMTLFENIKNSKLYLFDWVDGDTQLNRWLVYVSQPKDIIRYLDLSITHLNLIKMSAEICIIDIDKHHNYQNIKALDFKQIINDYLPHEDSLFDISDCKDLENIEHKLTFLIESQYNTHSVNYAMVSEPTLPIYGNSSPL